jgi:hypothetical protein
MKAIQVLAGVCLAGFAALSAQAATNVTVGQWDFDQKDLRATIGEPIQLLGGSNTTYTTFQDFTINGATAHVMGFPATTSEEGYIITHGAEPNGGGTRVNEYTLLMDYMFTSDTDGSWRALLQAGPNTPDDDAELLINPLDAAGTGGDYFGFISPDEFHRLAFTVDLTNDALGIYIDGALVSSNKLNTQIDGRWSLGPTFLLFTDNNGDTAPGFVNSIQFRSEVLSPEAIAALGGASAGGLGSTNAPADFTLAISKATGAAHISMGATGNYQLQSTTNIAVPNWKNVGGVSNTNAFDVPTTDRMMFFRVQKF